MIVDKKMYAEYSDDDLLEILDDHGPAHLLIHETAKRIRAKNDRIAECNRLLGKADEILGKADKRIAALEAEREEVRGEVLRDAENAILSISAERWASLGSVAPRLAIEELRAAQPQPPSAAEVAEKHTAPQPEPEAETRFRRIGHGVVVDWKTRQLVPYKPKEHGNLENLGFYDVPTGYALVNPDPATEAEAEDGPAWNLADMIHPEEEA